MRNKIKKRNISPSLSSGGNVGVGNVATGFILCGMREGGHWEGKQSILLKKAAVRKLGNGDE